MYLCLVLNPVFMSIGSVMMRKMRKLDENVVACYLNGFGSPVFVTICYISGGDLSAWRDFEAIEWICVVSLAIVAICAFTFRFKAF